MQGTSQGREKESEMANGLFILLSLSLSLSSSLLLRSFFLVVVLVLVVGGVVVRLVALKPTVRLTRLAATGLLHLFGNGFTGHFSNWP